MSPTSRQSLLAEMVRQSRDLLVRYLGGFDERNYTQQAPSLPNHVAWTLGHLALTLHRTAERFDGQPLPASDFITGNGQAGDATRYDTESVSFGSKPIDDSNVYPSWSRCQAAFNAAIERLVAAIQNADDAKLDSITKWGNAQVPLYTMAGRMVFHNGTHTGQIADLRRALGIGSIFA